MIGRFFNKKSFTNSGQHFRGLSLTQNKDEYYSVFLYVVIEYLF